MDSFENMSEVKKIFFLFPEWVCVSFVVSSKQERNNLTILQRQCLNKMKNHASDIDSEKLANSNLILFNTMIRAI